MLISYAQNFEDIVLWRALSGISNGRYVDVGAADPVLDSVTKLFYDRGWTGLNIEPVAEYAARLRDMRPRDVVAEACAGTAEGDVTLYEVPGTGLSSVSPTSVDALRDEFGVVERTVPVRPLTNLLRDAELADGPIHFLKIDVEGAELDVINGLDLDRIRPWIVVVESTEPRRRVDTSAEWDHLLIEHRYVFTLHDGLNRFYVAAEHPEIAETLSYPACIFDHPFVTAGHAEALDALAFHTEQHEVNRTALEHTTAEYDRTVGAYTELESEFRRVEEAYRGLDSTHLDAMASYERLDALYHHAIDARAQADKERDAAIERSRILAAECEEALLRSEALRAELGVVQEALRNEQGRTAAALQRTTPSGPPWFRRIALIRARLRAARP
jgi:FkbM family methyltransferase